MKPNTSYSIFNNSRFYILVSSILLSVAVLSLTRQLIPSDQLYFIRLQQLFGLLCILYWYLALAISPIGYLIGKHNNKHLEFARRAIGVSAAYFALLHVMIAFWGQLDGFSGILMLPILFKYSLGAGLFGLVVLILMAATSFDRAIKIMTFRRWKWLHRMVYLGGILVVLHIWSIGTHLGYSLVQIAAFAALIILSGLELYRFTTLLSKKYKNLQAPQVFYAIFLSLWAIIIGLTASIPYVVDSYRSHDTGHEGHRSESDHHA